MSKKLSEMTLEELWELFPIILKEHDERWNDYFLEETLKLKDLLPKNAIISHIGSTAIRGIWAKPIIDILVEVEENIANISIILQKHGWIKMSESENSISLNKGYTENGFADKVYHLHLRYFGDNKEIYFRDFLNSHPEIAKEYEALKIKLWKIYEHNRDGYTQAKTEFVLKYTTLAALNANKDD